MRSPLPISAADAGAVLAALRAPAASLDRSAYDLDHLADATAGTLVVPVHKTGGTSPWASAWRS